MANRAIHLLENMKQTCSTEIFEKAEEIIGDCEKATPGWFQRLFKEVLEKEVTVTRVHTIVEGANDCVFEIQC